MKGTIVTPRVSKIAISLLTHLFYDAIVSLEKEKGQIVFGKQLDIRACMKQIQEFILTHPYGEFSIEVLDSIKRDLENPMLAITFRNFSEELDDKIPMIYHIIIDETYTTFDIYKESPDGILITIRL